MIPWVPASTPLNGTNLASPNVFIIFITNIIIFDVRLHKASILYAPRTARGAGKGGDVPACRTRRGTWAGPSHMHARMKRIINELSTGTMAKARAVRICIIFLYCIIFIIL